MILALYALIRLLRSPKPMETLTMTIGNAVRDATAIFRPKRGGGSSGLAWAARADHRRRGHAR